MRKCFLCGVMNKFHGKPLAILVLAGALALSGCYDEKKKAKVIDELAAVPPAFTLRFEVADGGANTIPWTPDGKLYDYKGQLSAIEKTLKAFYIKCNSTKIEFCRGILSNPVTKKRPISIAMGRAVKFEKGRDSNYDLVDATGPTMVGLMLRFPNFGYEKKWFYRWHKKRKGSNILGAYDIKRVYLPFSRLRRGIWTQASLSSNKGKKIRSILIKAKAFLPGEEARTKADIKAGRKISWANY